VGELRAENGKNNSNPRIPDFVSSGRRKKREGDDMKHVISFSGGKDSTAMLLMMLEKSYPI